MTLIDLTLYRRTRRIGPPVRVVSSDVREEFAARVAPDPVDQLLQMARLMKMAAFNASEKPLDGTAPCDSE